MTSMLDTYRRLYLTFFDMKNGRMRVRADTLKPTGAGALVAMITRGKLTRDINGIEFEIVTDPSKDPTLKGNPGDPGLSAYQVARANGYGGTETQWLASLAGQPGKSAYQIARDGGYGGTETQWLASLKGTDGTSPALTIGTVTTLAAGATAAAALTGTSLSPKLDLGLPRGAAGANASALLGTITVSQTATIAIAAGPRRVPVTIPASMGVAAGDPLAFCPTTASAAYAIHDVVATSATALSVGVTGPLLAIGAAMPPIAGKLFRLNT